MLISSRRKGTNEVISTFGDTGTGKDYTSVNTFETDTDNALVTLTTSPVLECYTGAAPYDVAVSFSGATSNATYFRTVRPAPGHKHDGTASTGVRFACTGVVSGASFRIDEDFTQLQDLVIRGTYNSTGTCIAVQLVGVTTVVGLIIDTATNSGGGKGMGIQTTSDGGPYYVINCLAYGCRDEAITLGANGTSFCYNCTGVNSSYGIRVPSANIATVKNCLCSGNSVEDFEGGSTVTEDSTHVVTSDASTPMPANSFTNRTFTFVNAGANDFHLAAGDSGARGQGTDLSGDSAYAFNDDLDGTEIGTWSIGSDSIPVPTGNKSTIYYYANTGVSV